jgi:hypothetical protein
MARKHDPDTPSDRAQRKRAQTAMRRLPVLAARLDFERKLSTREWLDALRSDASSGLAFKDSDAVGSARQALAFLEEAERELQEGNDSRARDCCMQAQRELAWGDPIIVSEYYTPRGQSKGGTKTAEGKQAALHEARRKNGDLTDDERDVRDAYWRRLQEDTHTFRPPSPGDLCKRLGWGKDRKKVWRVLAKLELPSSHKYTDDDANRRGVMQRLDELGVDVRRSQWWEKSGLAPGHDQSEP